jgi:enoyl-CoA hydratase/carnithine racemase
MEFKSQYLEYSEPAAHVLQVRINRPEVRNALNTATTRDLLHLWETLTSDPLRYRCVILTGAGEQAFCAGGDLKERDGMTDERFQEQHALIERMVRAHVNCPVPSIAAVNGAAFGGGCETALNCDFIYAVSTARFALTETRLGILPGAGGTQQLTRAVGLRRARELILSGNTFTAGEALEWGMVNKVCAADQLMPGVLEIAARIASNAPLAVRQARTAMQLGGSMDLLSGLMFEVECYHRLVSSEDRREGIAAFNEKRAPKLVGH